MVAGKGSVSAPPSGAHQLPAILLIPLFLTLMVVDMRP